MSDIKEILSKYKSIAMIGVSNDPTKASTIVMKYMQKYGFKVYPVNPSAKGQKILGEEVFAKITEIKKPIDIVDVFRPSKEALDIAKDTVSIGAKVLLGDKNHQYFFELRILQKHQPLFFQKMDHVLFLLVYRLYLFHLDLCEIPQLRYS
jgi:predicted CoA-binding protein